MLRLRLITKLNIIKKIINLFEKLKNEWTFLFFHFFHGEKLLRKNKNSQKIKEERYYLLIKISMKDRRDHYITQFFLTKIDYFYYYVLTCYETYLKSIKFYSIINPYIITTTL